VIDSLFSFAQNPPGRRVQDDQARLRKLESRRPILPHGNIVTTDALGLLKLLEDKTFADLAAALPPQFHGAYPTAHHH
jgi:hypothetical protein